MRSALIFILFFAACIHLFESDGFDERRFVLEFSSLFNQRKPPPKSGIKWQGDWIFRRLRLEKIDAALEMLKPDVAVFTEVMQRDDSPKEKDSVILGAGALQGYDWREHRYLYYHDTAEWESVALATSLPASHDKGRSTRLFTLADGIVSSFPLNIGENGIVLLVLKQPNFLEEAWIREVWKLAEEELRARNLCSNRLVIAGTFDTMKLGESWQLLLDRFELKDSSDGRCEELKECITATPSNELYRRAHGEIPPSQNIRVYVPRGAIVYSSSRNLDERYTLPPRFDYLSDIQEFSPSVYSGWGVSIRLSRCTEEIFSSNMPTPH